MLLLLELFCLINIVLSLLIAFSFNPIYSIIFLILVFCNTGISLFLYNLDFFGLLFIIIYVGAIAILFLFIIMMLNIKNPNNNNKLNFNFINKYLFLFFIILGLIIGNLIENSINDEYLEILFNSKNSIFNYIDKFYSIKIFGQYFYNFFNMFFLLAGLILLVALIGAVTLTLDFSQKSKSVLKQVDLKQLSKSSNIISLI